MAVTAATAKTVRQRERFWSRVDNSGGPDACWSWQAGRFQSGYGKVRHQGRTQRSHRVAYEYTHGLVPEGAKILHSCDNPPCCNPRHLRPGGAYENTQDALDRGRYRNGTGYHKRAHKLTDAQVAELRQAHEGGASTYALAQSFSLHPAYVSRLVHGHRRQIAAGETHCRAGHLFDEANTYLTPQGHRRCRACDLAKARARRARRREAASTSV